MDKYAIIVAGGSGTRMGSRLPKQFLLLGNKPMVLYSISAFLDAFTDVSIILVLPQTYLEEGRSIIRSLPQHESIVLTPGGTTRFESVQNGLQHVPLDSIVFVHDGVRCLVTPSLIQRCYLATLDKGNAIPAIAAVDTIRIQTLTGNEMIDRKKVMIIQTPQTFVSDIIKKAFMQEYRDSFTDEASVVESFGEKIYLVEGELTNIKITTPIDLLVAERILNEKKIK